MLCDMVLYDIVADFRHEPVRSSRSQRKDRTRFPHHLRHNVTEGPMRPSRATILIYAIQSQRQHPCRQPSPCLCFHRLNPLWQIGRA